MFLQVMSEMVCSVLTMACYASKHVIDVGSRESVVD